MSSILRHLKLVTWHNQLVTDPDLCLQLPQPNTNKLTVSMP